MISKFSVTKTNWLDDNSFVIRMLYTVIRFSTLPYNFFIVCYAFSASILYYFALRDVKVCDGI